MLKFEKIQYLNSISHLNYTRYEKRYHTKLFITKWSTNLNRNIFLRFARRKKNYCINQPDCWYRTDKTFLLSQQIFSFPNKPICWTTKEFVIVFCLTKLFKRRTKILLRRQKFFFSSIFFSVCIFLFNLKKYYWKSKIKFLSFYLSPCNLKYY